MTRTGLSISAIIPTLDEAVGIGAHLAATADHGFDEIIVVDGGSRDATCSIVTAVPGVRLLKAPLGRGAQLDAGLRAATSEAVVLLHADTRLPEGALEAMASVLAGAGAAGGAFRLVFDDPRPLFRFYAWWTRFDTAVTTFGDQAMFARRQTLLDAGGLPHWPFLEDVEVRRRLCVAGRFIKLPLAVTTSARRFHRHGAVRQQLLNVLIVTAFWLGASPARLARLYRPQRTG
jgi:rSAM/selenodomain-associated transferase 2